MEHAHSVPRPPRSGLAIAALVLGIVALASSFLPIINNASFVMALIGLIFAIVGIVGIRKGKKSGMGMAIAALVICIVAGGVVLGTQAMYSAAIDESSKQLDKMTGDATDEVLGVDVQVDLGQYVISKDQYGLIDSNLPVVVTNLLDESASYWVKVEALDASGARIDDYTVYVNDLGAGQSTTLEAFPFVSSDKYDAMQGANFSIVSVSEM